MLSRFRRSTCSLHRVHIDSHFIPGTRIKRFCQQTGSWAGAAGLSACARPSSLDPFVEARTNPKALKPWLLQCL